MPQINPLSETITPAAPYQGGDGIVKAFSQEGCNPLRDDRLKCPGWAAGRVARRLEFIEHPCCGIPTPACAMD